MTQQAEVPVDGSTEWFAPSRTRRPARRERLVGQVETYVG